MAELVWNKAFLGIVNSLASGCNFRFVISKLNFVIDIKHLQFTLGLHTGTRCDPGTGTTQYQSRVSKWHDTLIDTYSQNSREE